MKIEVRPLPVEENEKWHGKVKDESFKRPNKLPALVDGETMRYSTGLTDEDVKHLRDNMRVTYDLSDHYNPEKPHPFWDSQLPIVKLENNTMFFNDEVAIDYIKIKIMKASKYVANSLREWEEGYFPEATHYIHDENEEIEVQASKIALKNKAVIESAKLSDDKKAQIILILSGKLLKGASSETLIVEMNGLIEENPEDVLRYMNMDKKRVSLESLVHECLEKNVLRKQGHKIMYHDSVLGEDVIDVIEYLELDENQDLKLRLMNTVAE